MSVKSNKIIYGAASLGQLERRPQLYGDENESKVLSILKSQGIVEIDSAQIYGESESVLGKHKVLDQGFTVSTKWVGGWQGKAWASHDNVISSYKESLKKLNVSTNQAIDIFYIHCPDVHTPFEETLRGVNDAHKDGGFQRFGLSNYTPQQVREVLDITTKNGWVKPTVYQGSYSAVSRKPEDELLPLLRENGIVFYAYSPISGGFLTKNREFVEQGQGRFGDDALGGIYRRLYNKENFLSLLDDWEKIANEEGASKAELAFRWVNYHSALKPELGDGIIFGASSFEQLETTPQLIQKGPLKESSVKQINQLWDKVKDDSIIDNFQAVFGGE